MNIGLFVGSFDPFTIGHQDIVNRALKLFDKVVVGVGINNKKTYMLSSKQRVNNIIKIYEKNNCIEVVEYSDLTIDLAKRVGAKYIIKGIRGVKDLESERQQADINLKIGGIDTIILIAKPQYESISSSMVRELINFGQDVTKFLP